ncbi:MAG: EamA family transporter [Candidatus Andersenbacteria bacterium]
MPSELLIAIFGGLGGMLGWGLADFFAKKTIDEVGDVVSLAWGHVFGTIVLLIMVLYQFVGLGHKVTAHYDLSAWLLLAFFGVLQAAVYLLVYKGFGKGQVGVLSPVFASFSGLTAIISIVIFGEAVGPYILLGLVALFAGILLINIDVQALKAKRLNFAYVPGFKEIALATLLATFWTLSWDKFVGGRDWLLYTFFMYAFMSVAILIFALIRRINLLVVKPHIWKFLALIGFTETVAYAAISLGYSLTSLTSVVALLSGAFSLPTIILAHLFLKEKITTMQTVGSLITIGGIMVLAAL